jgi:YidC/Oxa1 family membrane protein insertase
MINALANYLANYINFLLTFFYNLVGDYGIAIILLTVLVNIITFPLTRKQLQATKKMQAIQPELKRLQEKYKDDKEKYNQATMEFMKDNKINPLGGCLPLLIQFPILIAVFTLLKNPDMIRGTVTDFNPFFLFFNLDLTKPDPLYILPILAAIATFFQQRIVMTDPNQKMFLYVFPVMIMFISISFPAGLVLYWLTNSLFSIGNHLVIKYTDNIKEEANSNTRGEKKELNKNYKLQAEQQSGNILQSKNEKSIDKKSVSREAPKIKKKIVKKKKKKGARKQK